METKFNINSFKAGNILWIKKDAYYNTGGLIPGYYLIVGVDVFPPHTGIKYVSLNSIPWKNEENSKQVRLGLFKELYFLNFYEVLEGEIENNA